MAHPSAAEPAGPAVPVVPVSRGPVVTPAREAVLSYIRRAIVLGTLQPGDKLREVRLAADLGVSRPTLREALNLLVQDGLLVQEPYRGLSVARLDAGDLRDLARTRLALDLIAAGDVVGDPTGERMQVVRDAWTDFERVALDPDPLVQHEAHLAFHHALWRASGNTMLLRLWPVTEAMSTIALAQDQAARSDAHRAYELHAQLFDAIAGGNLGRIEQQLRHHILDSVEELLGLQPE